MSNELIERIRNIFSYGTTDYYTVSKLLDDCEAEIERLIAENEALRKQNTALDEALEAKPVGEPVAWMVQSETLICEILTDITRSKPSREFVFECGRFKKWCKLSPLYTAPPSIDALIAEIDELVGNEQIVYCDQLITALDKYRGVK